MNVIEPWWWYINIGSGSGSVSSGTKPHYLNQCRPWSLLPYGIIRHNELMHLTLNTTNITWMEWIMHGIYHTEKKFTTWTDYIQGQNKTTLYKNNAQMDHHSSPSRHHLELAQKWYSTFGHMQFKVWLRLSDLDMLELASHDLEGKMWGIQYRHWIYHTSLPSFKLEKFMQLFQYRDALFVGTIAM